VADNQVSRQTEENIDLLEGLDPVRKRPGMYVGGTDVRALHHLIFEVVDNSIDEALAGRCNFIEIVLHEDGSASVTDNGGGIPVGKHKKAGISTLELVMTRLHAGGKFDSSAYKVSGGLHGVGVSAVNALSEWLITDIWRDGKVYRQEYRAGVPQTAVKIVREMEAGESTGTRHRFMPDYTIMERNPFNFTTLAQRFREMAFVTRGVTITLRDERVQPIPREMTFYFEGGIRSFVRYLNRNRTALHDPIFIERDVEIVPEEGNGHKPYTIGVEVAFQYTDSSTTTELYFANTIHTPDGGSHQAGLRAAITRTINLYGRKVGLLKDKDPNFSSNDTLEGLTAIVSVKHPEPQFESQTKVKLMNPEVQGAVSQVTSDAFMEFLEVNSREAKRIVEQCMTSMRARDAAKKARDLVRRGANLLENTTLPGKLADCSERDPARSELYIVEGDSAGGCFSGDTQIALADGRALSFRELAAEQAEGKTHFCYTIRHDGKIGLERVINARVTKRNAEVVRLTLDNGETIICTPDHPFMLCDGSYKAAAELTPGDSLMPLYRKLSDSDEPGITINGYEMLWDPRSKSWLFTHLVADWYNRWQGVYEEISGDHCHHIDFNKLNNNPTNIVRMPSEEHLALHRDHIRLTLHRPEIIEKCREIRQSAEFRARMSQRMRQPETRQILSDQAKEQWADEEYKAYMIGKWRAYYDSNHSYRQANEERLRQAQLEYWDQEENCEKQAERVRAYFAQNPQARESASQKAREQWQDNDLLEWRRAKTREQWTPEFRARRRETLSRTYYHKTLSALKRIELEFGKLDIEAYQAYRIQSRDKSLLRFDTFCQRYFDGNEQHVREAVANYNHRIISVERLEERLDVYDVEVPNTHNFALESGVFVHNSAKQGRDRHFQAILPLRGKILNTERARLNKILDNNEVKALISALGVGIGDDFDLGGLRYGRVIIMSVAGDEPTLVMDKAGQTEFVHIGNFIDDCIEGRRAYSDYAVMSFDLRTRATRFRPLKAVIQHAHTEPMYKLTTRYHRSIKVTSSHSVFVLDNGQVRLKKGSEIQPGDLLVASRRLPRPSASPSMIDLLQTLYEAGLTHALYLQGEDVRRVSAQRVLDKVSRPELWSQPRVVLTKEDWQPLINQRQAAGLSQQQVAASIGVRQPITISHWERAINRPILSHFESYLEAIGWDAPLDYVLMPSKLDERLAQDDTSRNARWREVSRYKPFDQFTTDELARLGPDVQLVPQAHSDKAFGRYLPISRDLMWWLGWYVAEGTLSAHQVSLSLGEKDRAFIPEIEAAIQAVFGEKPRLYADPDSQGMKLYFHSVAAARLIQAWGLDKRAHEKRLPDIVFSLPEELQYAFLEGYFLGDGTTAGQNLSFTTNSPYLKDGLLYLLGQLGLVATHGEYQPSSTPSDPAIQTRHPYYTVTICGKGQLDACRPIWQRHANARRVNGYLAKPRRQPLEFVPISPDLIGLEVLSAEEIEPVGEYVYDFSVQDDENFICGVGGLCAHNTDADVDGAHIRTLLLTFFFRYMTPLISEGHLYIAQPPLYLVSSGKEKIYAYSDTQRDEVIKALKNPDKAAIQRYKGLGEMNPEQLWETTMDPATRTLLQVTIEDAAEADRVFDMLMGSSVPPRRRFITTHARKATLDV
jgi:DNA gyrase/topoisomerase IV subunit B/transcriptional regulator with XRE-family HTH domain